MKTMENKQQKKTLAERFTEFAGRHQNAFDALAYSNEHNYHRY